jgi:glycosyltransferase involved in cell wall biosynthesis
VTAPFRGRLGIVQRMVPEYRAPLFDRLAAEDGVFVSVFAGAAGDGEGVREAGALAHALWRRARNRHARTPIGDFVVTGGVLRWLADFAPDALIIEANPRLSAAWTTIAWAKANRVPAIGWGLGELPREGASAEMRAELFGLFVRALDGALAYGSRARDAYVAAGLPADRVIIAWNAVDDREATDLRTALLGAGHTKASLRAALSLRPLPTVLSVGRIVASKRLDLLIDAFRPLATQASLLIVGDGPGREAIERQAADLQGAVRFAGHRTGADLARCFLASDLFVLPGPGGLALHQALAYGLPAIASVGDGTERDLIEAGVNGALVPQGDVVALRAALLDLLARPDLAAMGEASLRVVREKANLDALCASMRRAATLPPR